MKIMVSACLVGDNCKYNGGNNRNEKVLRLMDKNEVILVCPERMGGLSVPRSPVEICDGTWTGSSGSALRSVWKSRNWSGRISSSSSPGAPAAG